MVAGFQDGGCFSRWRLFFKMAAVFQDGGCFQDGGYFSKWRLFFKMAAVFQDGGCFSRWWLVFKILKTRTESTTRHL